MNTTKCPTCGQTIQEIKWQKIGDLEWSEPIRGFNWYGHTDKCQEMGGWLPTRIELIDLVDNHFDEIKDWEDVIAGNSYWSATTRSNDTHNAWRVYLNTGYTDSYAKTSTADSRCVRDIK